MSYNNIFLVLVKERWSVHVIISFCLLLHRDTDTDTECSALQFNLSVFLA